MSSMVNGNDVAPSIPRYVESTGQFGSLKIFGPGQHLDIQAGSELGAVGRASQRINVELNRVLTSPTAQTAFNYLYEVILDLVAHVQWLVGLDFTRLIEPMVARRNVQLEIRRIREALPPILTEDDL